MPLRALLNGTDIFAFEQTEESWEKIKSSPERPELSMPCCGFRAIPKTSSLGNYFFSHYRKPENCRSTPESKEHIYLKGVIPKAAKLTGWEVTTEFAGKDKDGEEWVADVFCRKKQTSVALEVQLAKQTIEQFRYRQNRYKKSGVRAAWFVSEKVVKATNYLKSEEVPIFMVRDFNNSNSIPIVSDFEVPLSEFVCGLLSGAVSWQEDPEELLVHYIVDKCWSCGGSVKQPYGYSINVYDEFIKTVPNCSTVLEKLLDLVGNELLSSRKINRIAAYPKFKGNARGFPYCAECIHCSQPQSNYYLMEKLGKSRKEAVNTGCAEPIVIGSCNGRWEYKC